MLEQHLLAPGPTPIPERARLAMAESIIHHRGPEFKDVFGEVRKHLKWLYETDESIITVTSSGTGAFQAAMTNFTSPDDTIVCVGGGKFGRRWADVGRRYNMDVVDLEVPWGKPLEPSDLKETLRAHPDTKMVTLTVSETSTGVFHPIEEISEIVHAESDALLAVDGITAVGVHRLPMDALDIDILVSGSQKAFGIPPGLGFIGVNERAWSFNEDSEHPHYYFDLRREKGRQENNQTAFTPAISNVVAAREILQMMREEGREPLFERHRTNAEATRRGVESLGLDLFAEKPVNSVTAVKAPEGIASGDIVDIMRDDYSSVISGGQKHLDDKIFRIGHIGFFDRSDILVALSSLELALQKLGFDYPRGAGVSAAQDVYIEAERSQ